MAISTIALVEKALKEDYLDVMQDQHDNHSGPFLALMEKSEKEVVGKKIRLPLKYGRSGGIISTSEDGDFQDANPRKYEMAEWETKNIFSRIMLTEKLIRASKGNKGAFLNMLESQLEDITNDSKENYYRQLFGDGKGVLATCDVNTGVNDVVVNDVKFLAEGQFIDILTSAGADKSINKREVIAVDEDTKTITISGATVTTANTDIVTIAGSYGNELTGLKSIFANDSTLYGIDRSSAKWFNANVKALGGELSEIAMMTRIHEAKYKGHSDVDYIQCSLGVARAFAYLQQTYKRNIEFMKLEGGYQTMAFNGIPLKEEYFMPDGTMDFLCSKDFKMCRMGPWDFLEGEHSNILHKVSGKASWEASLVFFGDMGCKKPKGQSRMTGITEHNE